MSNIFSTFATEFAKTRKTDVNRFIHIAIIPCALWDIDREHMDLYWLPTRISKITIVPSPRPCYRLLMKGDKEK
jgi:hypothetical protein